MTDILQSQANSLPSVDGVEIAKPAIKNIAAAEDAMRVSERIVDIRGPQQEINLIQELHDGLHVPQGKEKRIPTLLLYDEIGLKLFEEITYLDEYYLTNAEIEVLSKYAGEMALHIPDKSIVVELGSGNLRKVDLLLRALDALDKDIDYYALDLDRPELERTLTAVQETPYKNVKCFGLWGTYDDGLSWLQTPGIQDKPRTVLSLGSSIGNFSRAAGADFLKGFFNALGPQDKFLIGIDGSKDAAKVYNAYNDSKNVTHEFILNGLKHANDITGKQVFDVSQWYVIGEYNAAEHRHQAFIASKQDVVVEGVAIPAGEKLRIEESHKYDSVERTNLWEYAGVQEDNRWTDVDGDYAMILVSKNVYTFPTRPEEYAASAAPHWEEWARLWKVWDTVTQQMIPEKQMTEKPIKLRNACIFYLGHIPAFFDIKLTQTWPEQGPTDPAFFHSIFERGIDPDVDNPENCHAHSEVPETWPPLNEILAYQERVRARVKSIYDSGEWKSPKAARVLWLSYEHEAMHLETLLYMLIQSDKTLPPARVTRPDFPLLAKDDESSAVPNEWFTIPSQEITLGLDDPDNDEGPTRHFGWDIEKPSQKISVHSFQAKARAITVGEYAEYLQETGNSTVPVSWQTIPIPDSRVILNGAASNGSMTSKLTEEFLQGKAVRTLFGPVPLAHALFWPVSASLEELQGCAAWMGGRIPTLEEARSIYSHVDAKKKATAAADGRNIPAVNGHLSNNGVQETPPNGPASLTNGGLEKTAIGEDSLNSSNLFAELSGANVGFQRWHSASLAARGSILAGQGDMGGVWEWTSSSLTKPEGYRPMPLYPAYSSDFFDDKHYVVLGGSWATAPRLAGRKTFVNWYQRNYPYVWAGARLVRDL